MVIQVGDILKQPGLYTHYSYHGDFDIAEVDLLGKVDVKFKLTNAGSRIVLKGRIKTSIKLQCVRCLEDYSQPVDVEVWEEFLPEGSPELDAEVLTWDNLSLFAYKNNEIDVYEVIRQNILASIPIKPLCDENCKGIEGPWFAKEEEEIDPRLLPLLKIKETGGEKNGKSKIQIKQEKNKNQKSA